jgi:hypothetical protein
MFTFHLFPRLPAELRIQIWKATVEPRAVNVHVKHRQNVADDRAWIAADTQQRTQDHTINGPPSITYLVSSTPVPPLLHTCREARNEGLYQQAFSELAASDGSGQRYVWVNMDIDIICIGTVHTIYYKPVAPLIQRLELEAHDAIYIDHWRDTKLDDFINLKEMYLVCADGMWCWHKVTREIYWPCGEENVFMIDPDDGRMIRGIEMDRIFDREYEEATKRSVHIQVRDSKEVIPITECWIGKLPPPLREIEFL